MFAKLISFCGICFLFLFNAMAQVQHTDMAQHGSDAYKTDKAKSLYETAMDLYYNHRYTETVDLTGKIVARHPEYHEAYFLRGMAKEEIDDTAGALTDYDITLHLQPEFTEAKFRRSLLQFKTEQYERAITGFTDLLQHSNTETQAVFFKGKKVAGGFQTNAVATLQSDMQAELYNYIGLSLMHLHQLPAAISYFDSAISNNTTYPDCFNNRGMAKEQLKDTTGALQDYQQALQLDPSHKAALYNLTSLAKKAKDRDIWEKAVTKAIDQGASSDSYFQRGLLLEEDGRYTEAIRDFDRALALAPQIPDYYLQRAFAKEKLKDYHGALKDYATSLQLDPGMEKAYTNRGNVYFKLKQYEKAVEDYTKGLRLNPDHGLIYFNRGLALHYLGHDQPACQDLEIASQLGFIKADEALKALCPKE